MEEFAEIATPFDIVQIKQLSSTSNRIIDTQRVRQAVCKKCAQRSETRFLS